MTSRWLTIGGATAALIAFSALPAAADSTITINSGNVPTTAADFKTHNCSPNQGGGPYAGQDVWVFVLPGDHATGGDFVSVTASFSTDGDNTIDVTKSITADGGGFVNGGPEAAKAYIALPAGWKLITATAVVTGTATSFNLTHTCPASTTTTTSPPTTPGVPPTSGPPPTTPGVSSPPATTPGVPGTPTDPSTTTTDEPPLPVTGASLSGLIAAGVALIIGGTVLLFLRRRRDLAPPRSTDS